MEFMIQSGKPISMQIIDWIMQILRESNYPWDSFKNSIPDYTSFDGYTIQLDDGDAYQHCIYLNAKFKEFY